MLNFTPSNENAMPTKKWLSTVVASMITALGIAAAISVTAQANTIMPKTHKVAKSAAAEPMSAELTAIKNAFELKFEKAKVKLVRKMPFKDLYEVQLSSNELLYTNAATEFVMVGNLINTTDMRNLTTERSDELSTIDFKALPFKQSFELVKGDGSRHIAVFEDPNCGYCKLFRKTLEKTINITIHTFVIDILGDDSTTKAKQLLCATDPAHAWDDWMLHGKLPENTGACDAAVLDKNKKLAVELGVSGTPTVFFENGKRAPGAVPEEEFEAMLVKAAQK